MSTQSSNLTLVGFLATAIAVVAMLGVLTSYIAPLPLERAIAREAVFDAMLASADPAAAFERLRPQLADSAEAVQPGPDLPARIAAERVAMRARLQAEAAEAGLRLRVMIAVAGLMAAVFGAVILGIGRRLR